MHLTDDQLNEYLDHETTERLVIEAHLAVCSECAARLSALQTLFDEIESLPDLEWTRPIPASTPQLPRWLTWTATLQIVFALITLFSAAPWIAALLPPLEIPSIANEFIRLQSQWMEWIDLIYSFQVPKIPQIPALELPSLVLFLMLVAAFILWFLANRLLLRKSTE